jgi:hypothetical protein
VLVSATPPEHLRRHHFPAREREACLAEAREMRKLMGYSRPADSAIVTQNVSPCPPNPDDLADDYCRDRLSDEAAAIFEEHCAACPECANRVRETDALIFALKIAVKYAQVWRS